VIKKYLTLFLSFIFFYSNAQIISTIAGNGTLGYSGDSGLAVQAQMNQPWNTAIDIHGNIFISDPENYRIRRVDKNGIITTVAGNGTSGYSGDGGLATAAQLSNFIRVAVDGSDNLYISDGVFHCIRKVNSQGIISTIAGTGNPGFTGDNGPSSSALLNTPNCVITDFSGNLYISDWNNSRIRLIDTNGIIKTIAGNGNIDFSGDNGLATNATFHSVWGLSVDRNGNLFLADGNNYRVRKIDTSGIITTIAGDGNIGSGGDGDGGLAVNAHLSYVIGVSADAFGNIYISDAGTNRIRKVNNAGIISTIAGNGSSGYSGDNGPADAAQISSDAGFITSDSLGNIYIADRGNHCIRKIVLQKPVIDSFSPHETYFGDSVIISGSGFTGTQSVSFGDSTAEYFYIKNDSIIIAFVGNGATGSISVTTYNGVTTKAGFTYIKTCFWNGSIDNAWENANNWDCGFVPDGNAIVVIDSGTVIVNSNTTVWGLVISPGASFTVNTPYNLTILH
jgi:hypothetical protein